MVPWNLGRLLGQISGDPREASFLFQRLSVVIQRFNAIAFMARLLLRILRRMATLEYTLSFFLLMSEPEES